MAKSLQDSPPFITISVLKAHKPNINYLTLDIGDLPSLQEVLPLPSVRLKDL